MKSIILMIPLAVLAAGSASAQTIHGCIKQNGTLKVVSAAGACRGNQTPIS